MPNAPMKEARAAAWAVSEAVSDLHSALDAAKHARRMGKPEPDVPGFNIEDAAKLIQAAMAPAIKSAFKDGIQVEASINSVAVDDAELERLWLASAACKAMGGERGG